MERLLDQGIDLVQSLGEKAVFLVSGQRCNARQGYVNSVKESIFLIRCLDFRSEAVIRRIRGSGAGYFSAAVLRFLKAKAGAGYLLLAEPVQGTVRACLRSLGGIFRSHQGRYMQLLQQNANSGE